MKKVLLFLSIFASIGLSVIALFGCKKESATQRAEFIGYWVCIPNNDFVYTINIDQTGHGVYTEYNLQGGQLHITGDARVTDKKLKIGSLHHFTITEYPNQIDTTRSNIWTRIEDGSSKKANWKMSLKGPNFYLGDGTYYKAEY